MGYTCSICGADTRPAAELDPLPFVVCVSCGFVFRPDLDMAAVHDVYEDGRYEASWTDEYEDDLARRRDARVRLAWLRRHAPAGRLLDAGAAGGDFVAEAVAQGYEAWGVELTPGFARRAREKLGVDVRTGTLEDVEVEPGSLDTVTMWHVLEHVPHPVTALANVARALSPGGVLAVEVPNFGSAVARRTGAGWGSLQPDVHINQFAPRSLETALRRAGLDPIEVTTVPITPYMPLRERLGPRHVAGRVKAALWLRSPAGEHPWGHELLRAAARRRVDTVSP